jgi:hypothetical protein
MVIHPVYSLGRAAKETSFGAFQKNPVSKRKSQCNSGGRFTSCGTISIWISLSFCCKKTEMKRIVTSRIEHLNAVYAADFEKGFGLDDNNGNG